MEVLAHRRVQATRPCDAPAADIALLGVGTVGRALLARLGRLPASGSTLRLVHVANSRCAVRTRDGIPGDEAIARLAARASAGATARAHASVLDDVPDAFGRRTPIVIDATGSDAVASRHAQWLAQGIHVVTASKLGQGVALGRWNAIRSACAHSGARYGDSATVGAGLPLLRSLRALRAGGDAITGIAGVLSGSMAWLFSNYDGLRPFSGFVRQARDAGYTEPDPREDLSGEDVRRKLLILARAAGFALEQDEVRVESCMPDALAGCRADDVDAGLHLLDTPLRERYAAAYKKGEKLRHVARLEVAQGHITARVGIESMPATDALAAGRGTDNRVAIRCDRYDAQPLVIQGPGAGAGVTAAALLDDVLRIVRGADD